METSTFSSTRPPLGLGLLATLAAAVFLLVVAVVLPFIYLVVLMLIFRSGYFLYRQDGHRGSDYTLRVLLLIMVAITLLVRLLP